MVRVLHAADFHLDSSYSLLDDNEARKRRLESRNLVKSLVEYANAELVDIMLLAGDLFDSEKRYKETEEALVEAFASFNGEIVISPGNHDFYSYSSAYHHEIWPSNVHVFSSDMLEKIYFPKYDCTIWGAAFTSRESFNGNILPEIDRNEDSSLHIMVIHGDVDVGHSKYREIKTEWINKSGLDYIALGHQHSFSGIHKNGETAWAYPGCLEGHGFDETGDKGFLIGNIDSKNIVMDFVPFAKRRYQIIPVSVSNPILPNGYENDFVRVILEGDTEKEVNIAEVRAALKKQVYQLEIVESYRIAESIWENCGEDSLKGLFLKELHTMYVDTGNDMSKEIIEMAAKFGIAAMEHREL